MEFATAADGTRLAYYVAGAGEPLLLVSGQGGDHRNWDAVVDDFAPRHRVITFDHRGTGESDKPREGEAYSTRNFARDAVAVLEAAGIERAHAYGISMGGRVCQWLGIDHGPRFGGLVLGCTTPGNAHGVRRPPEVDAQMANRPTDPEARLQFHMEQMVTPAFAQANPEWVEAVAERMRNPIPTYAQKLHYLASEGHDAWEHLAGIMNPVLVLHGTDDLVNPTANSPLLAERIPGAELRLFEGGRHGYFIECRPEASDAVLEFLARHPL